MSSAEPMAVALRDVSRHFRLPGGATVRALDDVTLSITGGEAIALVGPSGSGKSTLLHCVGGIEAVDRGDIVVGHQEITGLSAKRLTSYRRRIGLVFQRSNLLPALTALDNVMAPVLPYRTDFDKRERARELLRAVGLEAREGSLPSRMSGGQQQRVAIARALINSPGLVLADEPTGALDSATGSAIVALLLELRDRHGVTVLIATHDEDVAQRCDRTIRLRDGRLLDDGESDRALERSIRAVPDDGG